MNALQLQTVGSGMAVFPEGYARLNITVNGENGDLVDPVSYDLPDADLRRMATEAVRGGSVPGITRSETVDFTDFVVDRFPASGDLPARAMIRPKTPFGHV